MGVNFTAIVLITFAIGSGLAAFAGIMNGLYYNEINFGMGLYLGVIGFAAAIIGGTRQHLWRHPRRFSVRGAANHRHRSRCRSPAPTKTCSPLPSSSSSWLGARPA
jgi:hypothetical protein